MPFTPSAKNLMLNALTFGAASLHDGYPGPTGLHEISGGSYARQGLTVGTASGEQRTMSGALTFSVPACAVRWIGFWDTASPPNFIGYSANGGAPLEFVVDLSANTVRSPGHGLATGAKIVFFDGTPPAPLTAGTIYFTVGVTTDTFQVALTSGGTAIALSSIGSSECQASLIVEDVFAAAGTENVAAGSFALNL